MKVRLTQEVTIGAALTVALAAGLLYLSWDSQKSTWESGAFVALGAILLLSVPLAILTHRIEAGLDRVSDRQEEIATSQEETASNVSRLAEEVEQTQADLRLTREQLSEVVRGRITENRSKDAALFKDVGEAPTQADVLESLTRAKEMGVISEHGCRVDLISDCYLRFNSDWRSDDPDNFSAAREWVVVVTLEQIDATKLGHFDWFDSSSSADMAVAVAGLMQASGVYSGRPLSMRKNSAYLSSPRTLGYDSTTDKGAVDPVRHIIQLFPPQWAICDDGVYSTDTPYQIAAWRLDEGWMPHMSEKPWVDTNSLYVALRTCQALYKAGALAVKPPRPGDPSQVQSSEPSANG